MAYNSAFYFPQNYSNPYLQQTPQILQPVQQNSPSINWVSGEREASAYPVAPNNAVALWSQTEPVVYLKQADATGKPSMKVYDLVERTQAAPAEEKPFATREELDHVRDELGKLRAEMKKKTVVKRREEEDEE